METQALNYLEKEIKISNTFLEKYHQRQHAKLKFRGESLIGIKLKELLNGNQKTLGNNIAGNQIIIPLVSYKESFGDIFNFQTLKPFLLYLVTTFVFLTTLLSYGLNLVYAISSSIIACSVIHLLYSITVNKLNFNGMNELVKSKTNKISHLQWGERKKLKLTNFTNGIALVGKKNDRVVAINIPLKDERGNYIMHVNSDSIINSIKEKLTDVDSVNLIGDKGVWNACGAGEIYSNIKSVANAKEIGFGSGFLKAVCSDNKLKITLNGYALL